MLGRTKKVIKISTALVIFIYLIPLYTASAQNIDDSDLRIFERLQNIIIDVSDTIKPAVVHIEALVRSQQKRNKSTGSGVICDENGYIITNHHVVFGANKINVIIPFSKKRYEAKLIGSDSLTDIAVLKIEPDAKLTYAKFGDSGDVRVGEWVLAIGNPFGLDGTVSFGIVSAKGRNLNVAQINEFIQTDAMIDPGSSGGPLVNLEGEVIGINSMIQGRGIGFTIPINTALKIKNSMIKEGEFERGWIGISMSPFTKDMTSYFNVPYKNGIFISKTMEDTPASIAGLKSGDIIIEYNGEPVGAEYEQELKIFQRKITATKVGSKVPVKIFRDGKLLTLTIKIGRYPKILTGEVETVFGFNILEITRHIYHHNRLETKDGVLVTFVSRGSPASEANLKEGDIIFWIEGLDVSSVKDFKKALERVKNKKKFLIKSFRGSNIILSLFKIDGEKEKEGHK